jgi:hypothetical protein
MPMRTATGDDLRDRLKSVRTQIAARRDEAAAEQAEVDQAKARFAKSNAEPGEYLKTADGKASVQAVKKVGEIQDQITDLQQEETHILELLGEPVPSSAGNGNGPSDLTVGADGWAQAARGLDLSAGIDRVNVPAANLLRPMAAVDVPPAPNVPAGRGPFVPLGQDQRHLYAQFPRRSLEGEVVIVDYRQGGERRSATIEADDDVATSEGHGFSNGDRIVFRALSGGDPLEVGVVYFVSSATADTFKVSETSGGAAIDVTADATAAIVVNLEQRGRQVTGEVERDPLATTEKANLSLGVELVEDRVSQFAAFVDEIPVKLLNIEDALAAFLRSEMRWQIDLAVDQHAIEKILDSVPPSGSTGSDLIAQVRNARAEMVDAGANPTALAVNPTTASSLDLTQHGDGEYLFVTREAGSASPLWGARIVEVPGLADPILIDPPMLGVFYDAMGTVLIDPYTGASTNVVRIRSEIEALMHVRNPNGAFVVA